MSTHMSNIGENTIHHEMSRYSATFTTMSPTVAKVAGYLDISWWIVFSPILLMWVLMLVLSLIFGVVVGIYAGIESRRVIRLRRQNLLRGRELRNRTNR